MTEAATTSRAQARDLHDIYYKTLAQKLTDAVKAWYQDMAERCAHRAHRKRTSPRTILTAVMRTCAFDAGTDVLDKKTMEDAFAAHVTKHFADHETVYHNLFQAKSRLLAAPMRNEDGNEVLFTEFAVPTCAWFLSRVLAESAHIAFGNIDAYLDDVRYESDAPHIRDMYYRCIKAQLDAATPSMAAAAAAVAEPAPPPAVEEEEPVAADVTPESPSAAEPEIDWT